MGLMVQSTLTLEDYLTDTRRQIESALAPYVNPAPGCPVSLCEAMRHSLMAPAKRLRPVLVLMAAEACCGDSQQAMPAACAVEMIHTYSLIHDDLPAMDDDDLRRGQPTCHKAFGEATAILAGDALQALAFQVLARDVHPPEVAAGCCAELAEAAGPTQLVGGQADDLDPRLGPSDSPTLEAIHARKTGAIFVVSLRLGALCAQASDEQLGALTAYGQSVGLAFQIADDLLDVQGDESTVGKRIGKDESRGKLTFPGLLGIEASRKRAAELVAAARDALAPFGPRGAHLEAIAQYVLERDR